MSYSIELSENKKFLVVKATGQISMGIIKQWSEDIWKKSQATGIRRFLFDVRSARNISSVMESYTFAYRDTRELDLQRNVRSAILASETDRSHDFAETTLKNAGYNVRIFVSKSNAIKWLEDSPT